LNSIALKPINLLQQKGPQGFSFLMNLDGLLSDSLQAHYSSWNEILSKHQIELTQIQFEKMLGLRDADFLNQLLKFSKKTFSLSDRNQLIAEKNQLYLQFVKYLNEDDLLPGVRNFLVGAKRIQIPIAIITENANASFVIERSGLKPMIQLILDGNLTPHGKPDPFIYLKASEILKYPVNQCIVFENTQIGLEAAIRAKTKIVGIGDAKKLQDADLVFSDFKTIRAFEIINWFRIM